jgi:hypothetical protein
MMTSMSSPSQRAVERRSAPRQRTLLAGRVSYGDPAIVIACGIRNLSSVGANIELEGAVLLTPPFRLLLAREGVAYDATIIWRRGPRIGLALGVAHDLRESVDLQIRMLQAIWKEMALR